MNSKCLIFTTNLRAVPLVDEATGRPVHPLTDRPLLQRAGLHVRLEVGGLVLKGEVGEYLRGAVHLGDHPSDGMNGRFALLPSDIPAVIVTGPDLLSIDDLPEAGAVLLGHVLTLVLGLVVRLQHLNLVTPRQSLHFHDRPRHGA